MIWLVWRQHRKQLLVALIGLAVLALALIPTGLASHKAVEKYSACLDTLGDAAFVDIAKVEACQSLGDTFDAEYESWAYAGILLLVLPLLVGLFWGAPLVAREIEQGTHRLVWTQGITRRRWAVTKIGLVAPAIVVLAAVYSALITWWMEPLNDTITERFDYIFFDQQGLVPVGYTLFAVAVGIFAGTVVPKTLPAMATTLVAFLVVRITVAVFVRPNIQGAETQTALVTGGERVLPNPATGNWITSTGTMAADGQVIRTGGIGYCTPGPESPAPERCGEFAPGSYNEWVYQPGDRFWLFQWVELGIYVVLAAALLYGALRRVRLRLS